MPRVRLNRAEKRKQTHDYLLEAAFEVFSQQGYNGASVDDVAYEAGFTKGAVYDHFENKEGLFLALVEQQLESEISQWHEIYPDESYEESFVKFATKQRVWHMLLLEFYLFALRNPTVNEKLSARYRQSHSDLVKVLQEQSKKHNKELPLPAEEMAWAILSFGHGLSVLTHLNPSAIPENLYENIMSNWLPFLKEAHKK